jgi:negative regulator of genetic competence, sporulation and motility
MKIERIDDKTVKCFLSNEELEEYDIDYKDFVTRSDKAKEVVQEIIEQAEEEVGYKPPKYAFDLQIMMLPDEGLVLVLSEKEPLENKSGAQLLQALQEMKVLSPLRMCGYVKSEIRKQSKEAGLFVYNKPSYACLATRIPTGTEIDEEKIKQVETAETFLFDLGFSDFRVRWMDNKAKIQMPESQLQALMEKREVVLEELSKIFDEVLLDLRTR